MGWSSWLLRKRRYLRVRVADLNFTGEQSGEVETALKFRVVQLLRADSAVTAAYLARASSMGLDSVVLCIRRDGGSETRLVEGTSALFGQLFPQDVHMDVLFLDELLEARVLQVCSPFYLALRDTGEPTP